MSDNLMDAIKESMKEMPANAVPLEYIIYYIAKPKEKEQEFVRLFKSDTGYEIRHIVDDNIVYTVLDEDDITFGDKCADITFGDWKGIHMSCKDTDILPLTSLILDSYKEAGGDDTD